MPRRTAAPARAGTGGGPVLFPTSGDGL